MGELYGSAIETRLAKDLPEVIDWLGGKEAPSTIQDANFSPARLLTLRTRNSAAYKGISALLLKEGALDFRSGDAVDLQMYFDERIDIHHIFPRAYCNTKRIDPRKCDSIVNKTPLSAKTNRMIGGNAPSVYIARLQKYAGITVTRMEEILESHVINYDSMSGDDFDKFFSMRQNALLDRIEKAMGKQISRETTDVDDVDETEDDEVELATELS
ncbi:hypothetical protein V5G20_01685 [Brevibacillus borstelensis]|uniref:hypothetical protein n=1 Tax=Brevibacillus borstelensis TaxID=45462 RepID=UPI0030D18A8C